MTLHSFLLRLCRSGSFRLLALTYAGLFMLGAVLSYLTGNWSILPFILALPFYILFKPVLGAFIFFFPLWVAVGVAFAALALFHKKQSEKDRESRSDSNLQPGSSQTL